jgi:RNA polymerase sigma factor for flagellar operon FliA
MLDRMDPAALFLDSLSAIEGIAASVCRMYSVWGDDADEFASWAKERLMENDYAVLRKYRGESELTTFLTVVVTRLFHAHARERMGRWRPSAAAERLGQVAKDLEVLVHRDGCRLHEAGERLRSSGRTQMSDGELGRLLAKLPAREPLRPVEVGADPLEHAPGAARADERVSAAESERHRAAVLSALFAAMRTLQPEERMIVRMNLADGRSVADVARALNLDQRALYRRIERLREQLRSTLESQGISRGDVRELLEEASA